MDDESLIELLLLKGEGLEVDYKLRQYDFENASDVVKSELLKDILAFVNAWRSDTAYILIGIQDDQHDVVGLDNDIDDSRLQQFVNFKTNRPVNFGYRSLNYKGTTLGLYTIPLQERPVFATRAFGRVKADTVYVRRGSSTAEAKPDEIARMGAAASEASYSPCLNFAIDEWTGEADANETLIGSYVAPIFSVINRIGYDSPQPDFPDYLPRSDFYSRGWSRLEFYREMAVYVRENRGMFRFRVEMRNDGNMFADDVKIFMRCPSSPGFRLSTVNDLLELPDPNANSLHFNPKIRSVLETLQPKVVVREQDEQQIAILNIGKIHTGETVYSEYVCLICPSASMKAISISVHCDQLKSPLQLKISTRFNVIEEWLTLEDIKEYYKRHKKD